MTVLAPTLRDVPTETDRPATAPPVRGGPVLMADCATPLAGETLLSLLWKRWDRDA